MSDWKFLNQHRITQGAYASTPEDGFNGAFRILVNGLFHNIIASDGMGWQHVSVSLERRTFVPSWQAMCKIKDLFWNPEDWVCQFHPAQSEYVNNHPGCLHLWRSTDVKMPTPPSILTGIKGAVLI